MQKFMRLSAILVVLMLALAACSSDGGDGSEEPSEPAGSEPAASEPTAQDPDAVCAADAKGCVEVAEGDPLRIASALTISGDTAFLGNDSQYGIEIAIQDRPEVAGHEVELVKEDAGCSDAATGQTAAQAIVADPSIVSVITDLSPTA